MMNRSTRWFDLSFTLGSPVLPVAGVERFHLQFLFGKLCGSLTEAAVVLATLNQDTCAVRAVAESIHATKDVGWDL